MKDTIKYNMKYSSLKGMFADGVAWKNRKDFIKTTANGFKSIIGVSQKLNLWWLVSIVLQKTLRENYKKRKQVSQI